MKVKFVYGIFPALVVYTDRIKAGFAGCANAMVVRIRPAKAADEGILEHELTHVRQSYRGLIVIFALRYLFSKSFRLDSEIEAYRKQLECSADKPASVKTFAGFLATKYDLGINAEEAERLLTGE